MKKINLLLVQPAQAPWRWGREELSGQFPAATGGYCLSFSFPILFTLCLLILVSGQGLPKGEGGNVKTLHGFLTVCRPGWNISQHRPWFLTQRNGAGSGGFGDALSGAATGGG